MKVYNHKNGSEKLDLDVICRDYDVVLLDCDNLTPEQESSIARDIVDHIDRC